MAAGMAANRTRRLGSLSRPSPAPTSKSVQRPTAKKHTCCNDPKVEDDGDGHMVCRHCFTQISESNIVADVTFQEDSRGAATVQGGFIGENARHARTLGPATFRRVGGGDRNSAQEAEANARRMLGTLCPRLGISEAVANMAGQIFHMASEGKFSAGRRSDEVIAACLYAACRRQKDNTVLLIDISELLRLNVFRLGEVYKDLCAVLYLGGKLGTQNLVEVESLIMKYCRRLEFGDATRQVAEDAVKIVRRMKRDWIVTGRHPAGLCGASIILAARMNNFRRSVREVVYVAKVADMTISSRMKEFNMTRSAAMTVDQFRQYGFTYKMAHDPPVLSTSKVQKEKFESKKRKREQASQARDGVGHGEIEPQSQQAFAMTVTPAPIQHAEADEGAESRQATMDTEELATPAPTQAEPRRDADGFLIPALPPAAEPNIGEQEESPKRKRGRPKKAAPQPFVISAEDLAEEAELEHEIGQVLGEDEIQDSRNELEKAKGEERAKLLADQQKELAAQESKIRRESEGITWWDSTEHSSREEVTADELEAEFANDPEVMNCELSPAEQKIKEQIWVTHNEDWLRVQQEKSLIRAVAKASNRNERGKKKGKPTKRKRRSKMGDGSTVAEATTPIETPADANMAMLNKRAPAAFSKYINYEALMKVYHHPDPSSPSASASRAGSEARADPNGASKEATPSIEDDLNEPSETAALSGSVDLLPSPPQTQRPPGAITSTKTAAPAEPALPPVPPTPDPTQAEAGAAAEESEGDEDDYVQPDDLDYGSDAGSAAGWGEDEDEREDIGEDDYQRALSPTHGLAYDDAYDEF